MRLLWALLRWIFSRLFVLVCIAALVLMAAVLRDWWNQRKIQEAQLQTLQTELGELHKTIREKRADLSLERKYMQLREREPSRWTSPFQWYRWNKEMEAVARLIDAKNSELKRLREQRAALVEKIAASSRALYQTQQRLTELLRKSIKTILIVCAVVFLGPFLWRALWYFILAPLARHASPVQLVKKTATGSSVMVQDATKNFPVLLRPGETLLTRMAWLHQYNRSARKRTRFLLDWKTPFISYAAGLSELTEVSVPADGIPTELVLSSAEDPDTYLCEIELSNHPGLVVYPSQVVALTGNLRLETRWTLTNLHSWIAGRLRYILFTGTGRLFLRGTGGVHAIDINGTSVRLSEPVVSAFESTIPFSTVRTETFWPYYRRLVPLFDYEFAGDGVVLRQTSGGSGGKDSAAVRTFDVVLNGIGKLLGL